MKIFNIFRPLTFIKRTVKYILSWIINKGISPNRLLLIAAEEGDNKKLLQALQQGAAIEAEDGMITPLVVAAANGHTAIVETLLQQGAAIEAEDRMITPLVVAAANGAVATVETLLRYGANIEAKDNRGRTPLIAAAANGAFAATETLLRYGANIEAKNNRGRTPLMVAAGKGKAATVETLLRYGPNVDCKDDTWGITPLGLVIARSWQGDQYTRIIESLIFAGATYNYSASLGKLSPKIQSLITRCNQLLTERLSKTAQVIEKKVHETTPIYDPLSSIVGEYAQLTREDMRENPSVLNLYKLSDNIRNDAVEDEGHPAHERVAVFSGGSRTL